MKEMGKLEEFKSKLYELIGAAESHIKRMPDKGLKEEDSQKLCLLNALADFERCVNGIYNEDLED